MRLTDVCHPSGVFRTYEIRVIRPSSSTKWQREHRSMTVSLRIANPSSSAGRERGALSGVGLQATSRPITAVAVIATGRCGKRAIGL
jgi:hypothetical protein